MSASRRPVPQLAYLLIAVALVLAASAVMRDWFSQGPVSAGLWGIEDCTRGCHGTRWDDVGGTDFDIVVAGYVGTVAGLLAAGMMLACGVLAAGASGQRGPVRGARTTLTITIAAMAWFLLRFFIEGGPQGLGWAAIAGPAAAIGGSMLMRKLDRAG